MRFAAAGMRRSGATTAFMVRVANRIAVTKRLTSKQQRDAGVGWPQADATARGLCIVC